MLPLFVLGSVLLVVGTLSLFVALNLWATWHIARDKLALPAEKAGRLLLVWCLPVAGALLVIHLTRDELERPTGRYAEREDPADTMESLQDGLSSQGMDNA